MVRTRHSRHFFERPDDCPVLDFEIFDTEGNSSDAVVYNESDGIFTYEGRHFLLDKVRDPQFPSNMNLIGDVFLMDNYRHDGETLIVQYLRDEEDDEEEDLLSAECKRTMLPKLQTEDKEKLTSMLNTYGSELAKEATEVNEKIQRMKTLMEAFSKDVDDMFPGIQFKEDLRVNLPKPYSKKMQDMEKEILSLVQAANNLAAEKPFSKKRKASD
jgi:hypothetical protein